MPKVFRLFHNGSNSIQDWGPANNINYAYDSGNRAQMSDTIQGSKYIDITSIPSPFARMQLVKDAFTVISKNGDLDDDSIYGRTVSDTLDIGEIFFNYDKFASKIQIIPCDIASVAGQLLSDTSNSGHVAMGDTLQKYLKSDAVSFNFNKMQNIYLLKYIYGKDGKEIIGATSPRTIFFSTANNLTDISKVFSFGKDEAFDMDLQPLYKRDYEYVKMWFYLRNTYQNFAADFPEIYQYLTLTLNKFNGAKFHELNTITTFDGLQCIPAFNSAAHVEVLGITIPKKKVMPCMDSDFEIRSTVLQNSGAPRPYPLVLPVGSGTDYSKLKYTEDEWGTENKAPFVGDNIVMSKRKLPRPGYLNQPWLTVSDLLEDYIIRVPHKLNNNYFNGNLKQKLVDTPNMSFLLPLKPEFFKYFTVGELMSTVEGKKMIEMEVRPSGGIQVTLRIPIVGNQTVKCITYKRTYYDNDQHNSQPVLNENKGAIRYFNFAGLIMPSYRFDSDKGAFYTLSCVSMKSLNYVYHPYYGSDEIIGMNMVIENGVSIPYGVSCATRNPCTPSSEAYKAMNYTLFNRRFDYIQVADSQRDVRGLIIPIFKTGSGNKQYAFSVDLGTSNTLIEYSPVDPINSKIKPRIFDVDTNDEQVCLMFDQTTDSDDKGNKVEIDLIDENPLIEKEFIPQLLSEKSDFHFPTRTVLSAVDNIDWNLRVDPFALVNIPFTYDKRSNFSYNTMYTNIKWDTSANAQMVLKFYINCLMLIIRNKVLLNGGDLQKTKITWFYPISMLPVQSGFVKKTWNDFYKQYFNDKGTTISMTESSAPLIAFYDSKPEASQIISVDIGGGTTDIAFSEKKGMVELVTSFRFATNDLFETPYSISNSNSGIIDYFKPQFRNILREKDLNDLLEVLDSSETSPSNVASFLFSLKENSIITKGNVNINSIDFDAILLEDGHFKVVFLLYYSAIIYHIACILRAYNKNREVPFVPRHFAFSGNGSKIIKAITPDAETTLATYTKMIIEKVANVHCEELSILGLSDNKTPKEATCRGGLVTSSSIDDRDRVRVLKAGADDFVPADTPLSSITQEDKKEAIGAAMKFFDFILNDMGNAFSFKKNFLMTTESVAIARKVCGNEKDMETYLSKAIDLQTKNKDAELGETLFFYPIKGALYALSNAIYADLIKHEAK